MDRSDLAYTWLQVTDGCVHDGEKRKFTWLSWKTYFKEKSKIGHPSYISEAQCPHVLSDNHIAQCKCRALPPMRAVLIRHAWLQRPWRGHPNLQRERPEEKNTHPPQTIFVL